MLIQPLMPFPILRKDPFHFRVELGRMVHVLSVTQFVDHYAIDNFHGKEHQETIEVQIPLTGTASPAGLLIADGDACGELFAGQIPLEKPIEALEILNASGETGYRILPYHSVGVKGGLLLAVRADKIVANGKAVRDALIAFSPTPLGDGGRYQALIGGEAWNWQ